jgi:hypothetical protein
MKTIGSLRTIAAGHAFVQNLRRGHMNSSSIVRAASVSARPSTNSPERSSRANRTRSVKQPTLLDQCNRAFEFIAQDLQRLRALIR